MSRIKIEIVKLGKNQALGMAHNGERRIEVDIEAHKHERDILDTFIHEATHIVQPELSEDAVIRIAENLTDVLWRSGYRRVNLPKRGDRSRKRVP